MAASGIATALAAISGNIPTTTRPVVRPTSGRHSNREVPVDLGGAVRRSRQFRLPRAIHAGCQPEPPDQSRSYRRLLSGVSGAVHANCSRLYWNSPKP